MNPVRLGALEIGAIPRVVGTISSRPLLAAFLADFRGHCDVAEIRLDLIGEFDGWEEVCAGIVKAGTPVILTLRAKAEGGKCDWPDAERRAVFERALSCASAVDIELSSGLLPGFAREVRAANTALIASYHDFSRTPELGELRRIAAAAGEFASITKISTMVRTESDVSALAELLAGRGGNLICAIGMGQNASSTRTSFPRLGSCLTYGYLDFANAPGQLSARQLVEHLRAADSNYDRDFISRREAV